MDNTIWFDADALMVNKEGGLRLEIEPGSNEGCYITLYAGETWIMSWRYACLRPDSREIKAECKRIKQALEME